jgi:radical SAM superfamily enzyme YgiQ (UPF0313 family)
MPHVTFIYPAVGRLPGAKYIRSWQMQPLAIAVLSALTPPSWRRTFFDDRMEPIDFDRPTDLAAISVETFTAKRSYQIAAEYRRRGVPVAMGGYHATFCPDEALEHADAICVGEAESVWPQMLADAQRGRLAGRYLHAGTAPDFAGYDRGVFAGKRYFKIALVETGRGCRFRCAFCAVTAFHQGRYKPRPICDVAAEIRGLREKIVFLVDDNIVDDFQRAADLFRALAGLNVAWVGQASVNVTRDGKLLDLMAASGCAGLLLGFESLSPDGLAAMGKRVNQGQDYVSAMTELRKRGIAVYGTFLLGLPSDTPQTSRRAVSFAVEQKMFLAAFNHVVPFPGTPLYAEMEAKQRLIYEKWWLSDEYRFADLPFDPECMTAEQVRESCHRARRSFYSLRGILRRARDLKANCRSWRKSMTFFALNLLLRREVLQKRGFPLGVRAEQAQVPAHVED